LQLVGYYN